MKKEAIFSRITLLTTSFYFLASLAMADTIILKDNQEFKGVVVEQYSDRVIVSTIDGEKEIMRKDIGRISFDLAEQNLTSIGDYYKEKKIYDKAYYYYQKALDVNPDYKQARDGMNYVGTYLRNSGMAMKLSHIQRLNESRIGKGGGLVSMESSKEVKIKDELGITLKNMGKDFVITGVTALSPAYRAGIIEGDILNQVWGKSITYMEPEDVFSELVSPVIQDVRIGVIRKYNFDLTKANKVKGSLLGIKLGFDEMEGLVVKEVYKEGMAYNYGVRDGDIIMDVDGKAVRYMEIKEVEKIINSKKGKELNMSVKREVVIWKKFQSNRIM